MSKTTLTPKGNRELTPTILESVPYLSYNVKNPPPNSVSVQHFELLANEHQHRVKMNSEECPMCICICP